MLSKEKRNELAEKIINENITKTFKKCHIDKFIYNNGKFIFLGRSITKHVNLITKKNEIKLYICNKDKTVIELIESDELKNFKVEHICNTNEDISLYNTSFNYFNVRYKATFFE